MSMLSFGVILVSFAFNTIVAFGLCLDEFSKAFIKFLLKNDNVLTLSKSYYVVISYVACALLLV
jgi:hypothetical protein